MRQLCVVVVAVAALAAPSALAQESPGAPVAHRATLTQAGAALALSAAIRDAESRGASVSIAVVDANGFLLAFERIGNAFPATIENSIAKASTAAQLGKPSGAMQDTIDGGRFAYLAIKGITPLQGGVPIIVAGEVVGGIGSSGAAADIDESIAATGAQAVLASAS